MSQDSVLYEKEGRVVTWTINRPDIRNAVSAPEVVARFEEIAEMVAKDHDVSCVILTGAGTAFSSGGDVKNMAARAPEMQKQPFATRHWYREGIQRIPLALDKVEVPIIAAVNGHAIGAGCDLAMMCDIRIAADSAQFGEVFVNLGIIPGDGGSWYLPRLVGRSKAFEMTFTGDVIDAAEAKEIGLISHVVPFDDLMDAARKMATKISRKPPEALRMTKRLLKESEFQRLDTALEMAAGMQALAQATKDHQEAANAFVEKRRPEFKGE
ncbi:MAG: crotonase/enoyl-CoA hydratase family protein [Alphaproteobacteria bacterium]|jgi:enoyl-CoA hydratase/carnithine racemase|nr:crotonase/enoyl-CoA hydratase family protein [Alphaproteobacteria bacterium]